MRSHRLNGLVLVGIVATVSGATQAQQQSISQDDPPPGTAMASLKQVARWFELENPFARRLKISFDTRPVPTYETLRWPTFEGTALLFQRGNLSISLFESTAPAMELNCRITCTPMLENSLGIDAKLNLGRINRQIPQTFFVLRTSAVRTPIRLSTKTLLGFGGLLDL